MLATTRFPTAGGFSSTMRPTILTGFQAQWKRSSDSAFQGEVWWHDGPRSDGGLRQSLLEGRLSLLGPGETIANALQSCKSLWWNSLIVCNWKKDWKVRKSLPQTHTCNYAVSMSIVNVSLSVIASILYSSSQVLKQHEEWRGNPFLLQRRRLLRPLDGRKKGGWWRVSTNSGSHPKNVFKEKLFTA